VSDLLVGLVLFLIVVFVFNIFAIVENDCREWFRDMLEYNIGVLILIFTLFLPTTIIMGLMCVLSITPFDRKG
jgi:hypothetical protein